MRYTAVQVRVGHREQDLKDTVPADAPEASLTQGDRLIIVSSLGASIHPLPIAGEVLVGRSSYADVAVDDPSISRRHALVRVAEGRVSIEDLGSANGTRIAAQRLEPGVAAGVVPGERVELGSVTLVLSRGLPPGARIVSPGVILADRRMRAIDELIEKVAPSTLSVLLLGETGSGKEVLAQRVHQLSGRSGPFLALNCAALTESLVESEVFGHEEGAFTGASRTKRGLLESANTGTVLIDEVGELSPAMQVKLLRVLESKQVTRVGALTAQSIDVRFVAATNRVLDTEVEAGRFRSDLFFRLAGITIEVPPLRERRADVEPLIRSFLQSAAGAAGRPEPRVSQAALQMMLEHSWPGNVRELKNTVERALLLATDEIGVEHLPPRLTGNGAEPASSSSKSRAPLKSEVRALEKEAILDALQSCAGNQSDAARQLGISRRTLGDRMDDFGIPRPRKKHKAG